MQSTWRASPSARRRSPTARAVWPPTPASTSSNTSVRDSPAPATVISASITRDSSPPDAASRIGAAGTPGFGASISSTRSAPVGPTSSRGSSRDLERRRPPWPARPAPRARASASFGAAFARAALSAPPARRARPARRGELRLGPLGRHLGLLERARARRGSARRAPAPPRRCRRACARAGRSASRRSSTSCRRPGLRLERVGVAAQLAAEVLGLDAQRREPLGQRVELGVDARRRRRPAARPAASSVGRPPSPPRGAIASAPPPAAASRPSIWRSRSRSASSEALLVLARVERIDLVDLEGEQVEVAVARARSLAQVGQPALDLAHARVGDAPARRAASGGRARRTPSSSSS